MPPLSIGLNFIFQVNPLIIRLNVFPGKRYGHLTWNIAEALNAWILEAREMPVLPMFERIRHQLMDWFTKRRTVEANTVGLLVTSVAERIQVLIRQRTIRYRHINQSDDVTFEVKSSITTSEYVINIGERTCSCRIWQSTGIPCGHALAVLCRYGYDPNTYTKQFFTLDYFHKTYKNAIFHPLTGDYTHLYSILSAMMKMMLRILVISTKTLCFLQARDALLEGPKNVEFVVPWRILMVRLDIKIDVEDAGITDIPGRQVGKLFDFL